LKRSKPQQQAMFADEAQGVLLDEPAPALVPVSVPALTDLPVAEPEPGPVVDLRTDPVHQFAAYRAWRSTALFLADQLRYADNGAAEQLKANAWSAAGEAGAIWRPWSTVEPFKHTGEAGCICWVCLYDKLEQL
jgi:hypothetical protein